MKPTLTVVSNTPIEPSDEERRLARHRWFAVAIGLSLVVGSEIGIWAWTR